MVLAEDGERAKETGEGEAIVIVTPTSGAVEEMGVLEGKEGTEA